MNNNTNPQHPSPEFSAEAFREAMGPGYPVALFNEQPELTGHKRAVVAAPRSALFAWRFRPSWSGVVRYVANSIAVVASRRRIWPSSMMRHHC